MKLDKIKTETQLPIGSKLMTAEVVLVDGSAKRLTLHFDNGRIIEAFNHSYNELGIVTTAEPVLEERYRVACRLEGVDMSKTFKHSSEADSYEKRMALITKNIGRSIVKIDEDQPADDLANDDIPF